MTEAHWQQSRRVVERIMIEGDLVLETPTSLRNGEANELTDMPLLLDPLKGYALLTGASLAGALRSYLRERELGFGGVGQKGHPPLYAQLFGGLRAETEDLGEQSPLITYDTLSKDKPGVELRDGVKLNPTTRTAEDKKKFDMELLEAGVTFPIRLELLVIEGQEQALSKGVALALAGFESGEISIGGRKRRGLGQGRVKEWRVRRYNMREAVGLIGWLDNAGEPQVGPKIAPLLGVELDGAEDKRGSFTIEATFALDTSLLIRSGSGEANAPDMVHLRSKGAPILSGATLAGALRARAGRIVKTIGKGEKLVDGMFGPIMDNAAAPAASRVIVSESEIKNGIENLVQNRVKLDRFTGGSYPGALFNQQPIFGRANQQTTLTVKLALRRAPAQSDQKFEAEIGLLLLLLKDLWTGDLPLGGESSVGRGRLQGLSAKLTYGKQIWELQQPEQVLVIEQGDKAVLEKFVQALQEEAR